MLIRSDRSETEKVIRKSFWTTFPDLVTGRNWDLGVLHAHGIQDVSVETLHFTIERTACYHFPVLLAWGGKAAIVNPNLVKQGRRKTDEIDAATLAEMDAERRWPISYQFPPDQMGLRILLRQHHYQSRLTTRYTKSLNAQLLKFGVTISREGSMRASNIRPVVEDLLGGHFPLTPELRACVPDTATPTWLRSHLKRLYTLSDQANDTAKEIWKSVVDRLGRTFYFAGGVLRKASDCIKLLETIPGVGETTAAWLLTEIGQIHRFPTANSLCAWGGCDLSLRVSAGHVTAFTRRKGHTHIHWLVTQAAQTAIRSDNPFAKWAKKRIAKGGKGAKQRAIGAVARRILVGAYWVLFKGEEWKPTEALKELMHGEEQDNTHQRHSE